MNELLKCFMINASNNGGIAIEELGEKEKYIYWEYTINKNKLKIYSNSKIIKEYNIKDIKNIYELNQGNIIVLDINNKMVILSMI